MKKFNVYTQSENKSFKKLNHTSSKIDGQMRQNFNDFSNLSENIMLHRKNLIYLLFKILLEYKSQYFNFTM